MRLSSFKRKFRNVHLLSFFLIATFAWTGCEKDYNYIAPQPTINPGGGNGGGTPATVFFATDIQPIFNASCAVSGCHSSGGISPDLSEGSAYTSVLGEISTSSPAS